MKEELPESFGKRGSVMGRATHQAFYLEDQQRRWQEVDRKGQGYVTREDFVEAQLLALQAKRAKRRTPQKQQKQQQQQQQQSQSQSLPKSPTSAKMQARA